MKQKQKTTQPSTAQYPKLDALTKLGYFIIPQITPGSQPCGCSTRTTYALGHDETDGEEIVTRAITPQFEDLESLEKFCDGETHKPK